MMDLDERKRRILQAVVEAYIGTGEPIGSKAVMDITGLAVSPATIRNDMSELEKLGLLQKPHTSAGRVPSDEGFRYYVGKSLGTYELTPVDIEELSPHTFNGLYDAVREFASRLADFSGCTVFALAPTSVGGVFTFDVMPSGKKTLAILAVSANGSVKTVFATFDEEVTEQDAAVLTPILNSVLSGFPAEHITDIRFTVIKQRLKRECPKLLSALEPIKGLISRLNAYELEIGGSTNLLSYPEFANIEVAKEYISMLSRRESIAEAIAMQQPGDGLTVKIGEESSLRIPNTSVISTRCEAKIPVILCALGPTRMNYAKLTAGLDYVSRLLRLLIDEEF